MVLPRFKYYRPETSDELEKILKKFKGQAKILAGGTDLLLQMKGGIQGPDVLVDIGNLESLQGISHKKGKGTEIMAGTRIADSFPSLSQPANNSCSVASGFLSLVFNKPFIVTRPTCPGTHSGLSSVSL